MATLTILAAKYLIALPVIVAVAFVWRVPRHERFRYVLTVLCGGILAYVFAKISSYLYYDPRPFVTSGIAPLVPHAADNGFPSDHTLLASSLAAALTAFDKRPGVFLWLVALGIGTARVAAGLHNPLDIAASMALAAVATWLALRVLKRRARGS